MSGDITHSEEFDRNQMVFTCSTMANYSEIYLESLGYDELLNIYNRVIQKQGDEN